MTEQEAARRIAELEQKLADYDRRDAEAAKPATPVEKFLGSGARGADAKGAYEQLKNAAGAGNPFATRERPARTAETPWKVPASVEEYMDRKRAATANPFGRKAGK